MYTLSLSLGSSDQRVGVGTAAGLHCGDLFGVFDVGDIEDANAAETVFLSRGVAGLSLSFIFVLIFVLVFIGVGFRRIGRKALYAAIEASVGHLDRHEHQILVYGNIALAAGADDRGQQRGIGGIGNVIDVDAVEISLEKVVALKCEVGVGEGQLRDDQDAWAWASWRGWHLTG